MVANTNPEYLGLTGAAKRFRIDGKSVHASTVFRWMKDGIVRGGHRVRLGYVRMGRRLATTQECINTFTRELAELDALPPEPKPRADKPIPHKRTPSQRQKAIEAAEKRLAAAGV